MMKPKRTHQNSNVIPFPSGLEDMQMAAEMETTADASTNSEAGALPLQRQLKRADATGFRLDSLKDEYLEKYAENFQLVTLIENEGLSPRAAVRRLGVERTPRAVALLYKRYQEKGRAGLVDHRWLRRPPATVLTEQVRKIILAHYFNRSAAGPRGVWKLTRATCEGLGLRAPKPSTVVEYLAHLPEDVKLARKGDRGLKEWLKQDAPYIRYENTTYANERWQVDHKELDFWVRKKVRGVWRACRAHLSAALDAHTRASAGLFLSTRYPDAWAIKLMFRHAIMPKGVAGWPVFGKPRIVQCDRGPDWLSKPVKVSLRALGIDIDKDPPRYPNDKGKVERFFRTLDTSCLRLLHGHVDAIGSSQEAAQKRVHELLTLPQLRQEIARWVAEDYHQQIHGETEQRPAQHWEQTVRDPKLPDEDELNIFLLHSDIERTIQGFGIRVKEDGIKHLYWSPVFVQHCRERVTLARNPEDMESVFIYSANREFICEAWDMRADDPRYALADVRSARREHYARLRSLQERNKQYMEEVLTLDRRCEQDEWQAARAEAAALLEAEELAAEQEADAVDVGEQEQLLAQFRRQDVER
jgi:transposase InsO family protein